MKKGSVLDWVEAFFIFIVFSRIYCLIGTAQISPTPDTYSHEPPLFFIALLIFALWITPQLLASIKIIAKNINFFILFSSTF